MSNNKKVYSFKSVGQLQNDAVQQFANSAAFNPIGILTPVSFAEGSGNLFNMSIDVLQQIRDNLKNLILTNRGERLMLHDYGANLKALAFEYSNEDIVNTAIFQISETVKKYMPFVELENFEKRIEPSSNGNNIAVVIRITYSVPSIAATNQFVEAIIYAVG